MCHRRRSPLLNDCNKSFRFVTVPTHFRNTVLLRFKLDCGIPAIYFLKAFLKSSLHSSFFSQLYQNLLECCKIKLVFSEWLQLFHSGHLSNLNKIKWKAFDLLIYVTVSKRKLMSVCRSLRQNKRYISADDGLIINIF